MKITSTVKRGKAIGTTLTPHRHADDCFVVSMSRFKKDYIRVPDESEIPRWLKDGYRLRMSNPDVANHRAPSLIAPSSIVIGEA